MERFVIRRKELLNNIDEGIIFVSSEQLKTRSNDTQFPFRQNSNFLYLTGFSEPNSILVMSKANNLEATMIFVERKNLINKAWMAKTKGPNELKNKLRMTRVYETEEIDEIIPDLLTKHQNVYLDLFSDNKMLIKLRDYCRTLRKERRRTKNKYPHAFIDIADEISMMRSIKDEFEIEQIKKAVAISKKAHLAAMSFTSPNKNEHQIAALLEYMFKADGGTGPSFPSVVAGGDNANQLHYTDNNENLNDNEMILIDAGAEFEGYASDVTRSFPINGKFNDTQKEIYQVALSAQTKTISAIKPGVTLPELHTIAMTELIKGLIELQVFSGTLHEVISSKQILLFSPHRTCHWLGLDVHDVNPHLDENNEAVKLKAGMVLAVEPGLYFPSSQKLSPEKYRGIGIRIEDTVLVTDSGCEVISKNIPKTIEEIENACAQTYQGLMIS